MHLKEGRGKRGPAGEMRTKKNGWSHFSKMLGAIRPLIQYNSTTYTYKWSNYLLKYALQILPVTNQSFFERWNLGPRGPGKSLQGQNWEGQRNCIARVQE